MALYQNPQLLPRPPIPNLPRPGPGGGIPSRGGSVMPGSLGGPWSPPAPPAPNPPNIPLPGPTTPTVYQPTYSTSQGDPSQGVAPSVTQTGFQETPSLAWSLQQQQSQGETQARNDARTAEARRLALFRELYGKVGAGGPSDGGPVGNEAAARAAAFGRAKDQAGQIARASLTGLREAMAGRGILGSNIEAAGTGQIAGQAGEMLGEVNREQLIQDLTRSGQIADRDVAAGLTRRGQDIGMQQALLGLLTSGRGLY